MVSKQSHTSKQNNFGNARSKIPSHNSKSQTNLSCRKKYSDITNPSKTLQTAADFTSSDSDVAQKARIGLEKGREIHIISLKSHEVGHNKLSTTSNQHTIELEQNLLQTNDTQTVTARSMQKR